MLLGHNVTLFQGVASVTCLAPGSTLAGPPGAWEPPQAKFQQQLVGMRSQNV